MKWIYWIKWSFIATVQLIVFLKFPAHPFNFYTRTRFYCIQYNLRHKQTQIFRKTFSQAHYPAKYTKR